MRTQPPPSPGAQEQADVGYSDAMTTHHPNVVPRHFGQGRTDTVTGLFVVVTKLLLCGCAP